MTKKSFDLKKIILTVQRILQNRFVLAILLVIDGFVFLFNPEQSEDNMGRTIALSMILAAGAMIIAKITAKERFIRFLPTLILLAAGGSMYFWPDGLSAYFRLLIALIIIINGTINLLDILGLTQAREFVAALRDKAQRFFSRIKRPKEIVDGMGGEAEKILNPLYRIVTESKWHKAVYFAANLLAVILGVLLLVQPNLSITIFGLIIIYAGLSDLVTAFKARKIAEDPRDREHGESPSEEPGGREKQAEG